MRRRLLIPILVLGLLLGLYLAPSLPAVRGRLLAAARDAAAAAGWELAWEGSAGNAWSGVRLRDARLRGPGVDVAAERLELGYFLPGLIAGELPLSLRLEGVTGRVDPDALALPSGGEGPPVRPTLRRLEIDDVRVEVGAVSAALPDLAVERVQARGGDDGVDFEATVATPDGRARVGGRLALAPLALRLDVERADAAIARHWWDGIEAGSVQGVLRADAGGVRADLRVQGGRLAFADLQAEAISGPVRYRHPRIEAELTGRALDGPARAVGGVDLAERRWWATLEGTPELAAATDWLARDLPLTAEALGLDGEARLALSAAGWTEATLSGRAVGTGRALGEPLRELESTFTLTTGRGLEVDGRARLGDGTIDLAMGGAGAPALRLRADRLPLPGDLRADATLDLATLGPTLDGSFRVDLARATVPGLAPAEAGPLALRAEGTVDGDGWQAFLSGALGPAQLEGAVVLQDGRLQAGATALGVPLAGLAGRPDLRVRADGPAASPTLRLAVAGDAPVTLEAGPLRSPADLRGEVVARLEDGVLTDLGGAFGPLAVAGRVELSPPGGTLAVRVEPVRLTAPVVTTARVAAAEIRPGPDGIEARGTLELGAIEAAGARLEPLELRFALAAGETWRAELRDLAGRIEARLGPDGTRLALDRPPLAYRGEPLELAGSVELPAGAAPADARVDLAADAEGARLRASGPASAVGIEATLEPGSRLLPLRLRSPLSLAGELDLLAREGGADVRLGGLELRAALDRVEGGARWSVRSERGGERFDLEVGPEGVRAVGALSLGPIAEALGVDARGSLRGDLRRDGEGLAGTAALVLESAPLAAELRLGGAGDTLRVGGTVEAAGVRTELSGVLLPAPALRLEAGELGRVVLEDGLLSGAGRLPSLPGPLSLATSEWRLSGDLAERRAAWRLGDTRATFDWQGGLRARAELDLDGTLLERPWRLTGAAAYGPQTPRGRLDAELELSAGTVAAAGPLDEVALRGELAWGELLPAAAALEPRGDLLVRGRADLLGAPSLRLDGAVAGAGEPFAVRAELGPEGIAARLVGAGLDARFDGDGLSLAADDGRPATLFAALPEELRIDGELSRGADGWGGTTRVAVPAGGDGEAALVLRGEGERLAGELRAAAAGARLSAAGELLPRLRWEGLGRAGPATLELALDGPHAAPELRGTLATEPLEVAAGRVRLPAQRLELRASVAELRAVLEGDAGRLELTPARLDGALALEGSVAGLPHRLALRVDGPPGMPRVEAALEGPLARGGGLLLGGELLAELALEPRVLVASPPAGLGTLRARARADLSGAWTLDADVPWAPAEAALLAGLALRGDGAAYDGTLTLAATAASAGGAAQRTALRADVAGVAGAARLVADLATLDLAALAPLSPVPLAGGAAGTLELGTDEGLRIDARIDALVAGRPVTALLERAPDAPLRLALDGAGVTLEARGEGPVALELGAPAAELRLAGELRLADGPRLDLAGGLGSDPLALAARLEDDALRLDARLRAAELHATAGLRGERPLRLVATDPDGAVVGAPARLELRGPLGPRAALAGELTLGGSAERPAVPVAVSLRGDPGDAVLELAHEGLELRLARDAAGLRAALRGAATLPPLGLPVEAALAWTPAEGFDGTLSAGPHELGPLVLRAEARGEGGLAIAGSARLHGEEVLRADAVLGPEPWRDGTLRGGATLDATLESLAPALPLPLRAGADLALSGTLAAPRLQGNAVLSGALSASGRVAADLGGARAELAGDGLRLEAAWGEGGWRAALRAEDAPVSIPELAPASLAGEAVAASAAGGVQARVPGLALRVGDSSVRLEAALEPVLGLDAALDVRLDLADLPVGPALAGRVDGRVALTGAPAGRLDLGLLRGRLELAGVGPPGPGPALGGAVEIAGAATAPVLELDLRGEGTAGGTLRGRLEPAAAALRLDSDLTVGALASDLELVYRERLLTAQGGLTLGDAALRVVEAGPARVRLLGAGLLADWDVLLDLEDPAVALTGPLAPLPGPLEGTLRARLGGEPWLVGDVEGLAVAGRPLGELRLAAPSPGAPLRLEGDALAARLDPSGLAWELERLELPVTPTLSLSASGAGRGRDGILEAALGGGADGVEVDLRGRLELAGDAVALEAAGAVAGGTLRLDAAADAASGWRGELALTGASRGPVRADLSGRLSGPLARPALDARVAASAGEVRAVGDVSAAPGRLALDLTVEAPWLTGPLAVEGPAWPEPRLRLATAADALTVGLDEEGRLAVEGALALEPGPVRLALVGRGDGGVRVLVSSAALPGLELVGEVPPRTPARLLEDADALALVARGTGEGRVVIEPAAGRIRLEGLAVRDDALDLELAGVLALTPRPAGSLAGSVAVPAAARRVVAAELPTRLPFQLTADPDGLRLRSESDAGIVAGTLAPDGAAASLTTALRLGAGRLDADLRWRPDSGPSGEARAADLPLRAGEGVGLRLGGEVTVTPEAVFGALQLTAEAGALRASGEWGLAGLLPAAVAPRGGEERRLDLRASTVPLELVPPVATRLPYLRGAVSGVAQLRGSRLVGQLVAPELAVLDTLLPTDVEFNGSLASLALRAAIAGSPVRLTVTPERLAGVATLRGFPLDALAEAVAGPLDVEAEVSAVARVDLPLAGDGAADVRVATEGLRLERAGVVTTGRVSVDYYDGALTLRDARFEGAGRWRAEGVVRPDAIDFTLVAEEADFTPMLGLVPRLAALEAGAKGDLNVRAEGTFARPRVRAATDGLELALGGSRYRLSQAEATLEGPELSVAARLEGLEPVTGAVDVRGSGRFRPAPLRLEEAVFRAEGAIDVPILGRIEALDATIDVPGGAPPTLAARGLLGNPFTVEGTLAPFDVRARGRDLALRAPPFLLASSRSDLELRARWEEEALRLSGGVTADQARFELGIRPPRAGPSEPNPIYDRVVFEDLRIRAPGRVRLEESFGSAELALDLTLAGTAAAPELSGSAEALRGTFQFSGRDFEIERARAGFDPTRGVFPVVDVRARTSFEKARVLPPGGGVEFVAPRERGRFEVVLAFTGEVEPTPRGPRAFSLDVEPELSSDALIQVERAPGTDAGPRPLTDAELVSLLTLGRLELSPALAGQGGLAGAVAQGALDTAVDLLLVSELQAALSEALGVDVVEIRTTAFSSILNGVGEDPFSVSLRVGGYLDEGLFASYRIGRYDDDRQLYALTNEFNLTYELGPLDLFLAGRVNFEESRPAQPQTELSVALRYAVDLRTSIETGIDLSDERQQVRFGVSLRF